MPRNSEGPAAIFGLHIRHIFGVIIFLIILLAVVNVSEITRFFKVERLIGQPAPERSVQSGEPRDIVVDEEMLSKAMREVQRAKLEEMEEGDGSIPTDRFFYVVELIGGSDLEGVDLTIEADHVILVSEGGTRTTIKRTDVKDIQRYKLAPSPAQ